MTHEEVRELLPGYAAGILSDATSEIVRTHLADGCLDCLRDLFERPVGLPIAARPPVAAAPAGGARVRTVLAQPSVAVVAVGLSLVLMAAAAAMLVARPARQESAVATVADLARRVDELRQQRAALAAELTRVERAAATAESASQEAVQARASITAVERELKAARLRSRSLKEMMRRQDVDFRQKQQSLEAVIARLSERLPSTGSSGIRTGRHSGCDRLSDPARGVCTAFCDVQGCDRSAGPECEPLRARYEGLTGARIPPCTITTVSERIVPCEESHLDLWSFAVTRGRQYIVTAQVVEAATAADLCLAGSCPGLEPFGGNDEVPCRSAPEFACPRAAFAATADATCVVAVTLCSPVCADARSARYELTVEGAESLTLVAQDISSAAGEVGGSS